MSLKQRFDNIRKKARQAFKEQHGNSRKLVKTSLTDQQVWHYHA